MDVRSRMLAVVVGAALAPAATAAEPSRFRVAQLADRVWRIDDGGADNLYLVAGTERALLIDTGLGEEDVMKVVGTLTRLPVKVVVTHGHPDHAGGAKHVAEVYAHPADLQAVRLFASNDALKIVPVEDGFGFDLGGGRRVTVISTPGHTAGSICLLASDAKILFTGDDNNLIHWQFLRESTPLTRYLRSLEALEKRDGFEMLAPGHGGVLDRDFISDQIDCARSILDGSCKDEPYQTFLGETRLCRRGRAAIAFDPARLR